MTKLTPCTCRNQQSFIRLLQTEYLANVTIINFYFAATRHGKYRLVACPVSMATTCLVFGHVCDPEYASHLEGDVYTTFKKRECPSYIHILKQL